ncbi:MAG: YbfB/YjiJ family MFS transporter [Streptosporangiaceae bacterium]|nr:YbfB/YjiJ family MFS transporter [Streptosporangiaceae bacterium]
MNFRAAQNFRAIWTCRAKVCRPASEPLAAQAGKNLPRSRAATLLAIYFAGGGVGILLSGLVVPAVLAIADWQAAWLALGGLALLAMAGAVPAARAMPETIAPPEQDRRERPDWGRLGALLGCYTLFGAEYIAYMTFIIATLKAQGAGETEVIVFWTVLGATSAAAAFGVGATAGRLATRPGRDHRPGNPDRRGLAARALHRTRSGIRLGGAVRGHLPVRGHRRHHRRPRALSPSQWTSAIATLTTAFALGQCIGPLLSGVLSDQAGGVRAGLAIGAALIALAAGTGLFHDRLASPEGDVARRPRDSAGRRHAA